MWFKEIWYVLEFFDLCSPHRSFDDWDIDFNFRSSCDKWCWRRKVTTSTLFNIHCSKMTLCKWDFFAQKEKIAWENTNLLFLTSSNIFLSWVYCIMWYNFCFLISHWLKLYLPYSFRIIWFFLLQNTIGVYSIFNELKNV